MVQDYSSRLIKINLQRLEKTLEDPSGVWETMSNSTHTSKLSNGEHTTLLHDVYFGELRSMLAIEKSHSCKRAEMSTNYLSIADIVHTPTLETCGV